MKLTILHLPSATAALLAALAVGQLAASVASCMSLVAADRRMGAPNPPRQLGTRATEEQVAANVSSVHLFGAPPVAARKVSDPASAEPSRGDYVLKGIVQINDPSKGIAIIARADGHSAVYRIGQSVEADVSLHDVLVDAVLLSRDGTLERLVLPHGAGIEALNASARGRTTLPGTASQGVLSADTQTTLRAFGLSVIRDSAGEISGLSGPGADAWQHSGLLPTDVIVSIDGQPVGDVLQQPDGIDRSSQAGYTVLGVLRDGNPVTIEARPQGAEPPRHIRHRTS